MLNRLTPLFAILPCLLVNLSGQTSDSIPPGPPLTLSERLGYTPEDKLLIVHADDVGLAHSVNLATFDALATGQVTSGSIMVPCAWLEEVTDFTRTHPQADLGLHLTLTSGSEPYQRGPVSLPSDVPSLITSTGYLYESPREAAAKMDPREVEIELKSQIRKARALGIEPTHLDTHQFLLFFRPQLFEAYLTVGRDSGLPVLLAKSAFDMIRQQIGATAPDYESFLRPGDIVIDQLITILPGQEKAGWPTFYEKVLKNLNPGVTQIIVHVAYHSEKAQKVLGEGPWGSAWRQEEFDFFAGPQFKDLLELHGVKLITWREIAKLKTKNPNQQAAMSASE